jgi:hypothetical protein
VNVTNKFSSVLNYLFSDIRLQHGIK